MKKLIFLLLAGAACFSAACKSNNSSTAVTDSTKVTTVDTLKNASTTAATIPDEDFAMKANMGGMTEVALGKLALTKTSSTDLKKFAQMMVDDHGKANQALMQIAQKKNISLPANIDAMHQGKIDSLGKLTGSNFDAAYVSLMVDGHQKTLTLMQDEANNGKDADFKSFAAKTAPVVQMHLDAIKKIHGSMK